MHSYTTHTNNDVLGRWRKPLQGADPACRLQTANPSCKSITQPKVDYSQAEREVDTEHLFCLPYSSGKLLLESMVKSRPLELGCSSCLSCDYTDKKRGELACVWSWNPLITALGIPGVCTSGLCHFCATSGMTMKQTPGPSATFHGKLLTWRD